MGLRRPGINRVGFRRVGSVDAVIPGDLDVLGNASIGGGLTVGGDIVPTTVNSGLAMAVYQTANVDLLATGFANFNAPLRAGKFLRGVYCWLLLTARTGTVTGAPALRLAQNGVDITAATAGPVAASYNAFAAPSELVFTLNHTPIDMTTFPLQLHYVAGSGATVLAGRVYFMGIYE